MRGRAIAQFDYTCEQLVYVGGIHNLNGRAARERVGRIGNHRIVFGDTGDHLDLVAVVLAQDHWDQFGFVAVADHSDAQAFAAEQSARYGQNERARAFRNHEVNFGVSAGAKLARSVVDIHFGEQRSSAGIDGSGGAHQFAGESGGREIPKASDKT